MSTKKSALFGAALVTLAISGCASNPDKLGTMYVSTLQYERYDCDQIAVETANVERRVSELYGRLKKERSNDNLQTGIGLLLFWPALFFLEGGDGPEATEYSRLKGEYEALRKVSTQKRCGFEFEDDLSKTVKEAEAEK